MYWLYAVLGSTAFAHLMSLPEWAAQFSNDAAFVYQYWNTTPLP